MQCSECNSVSILVKVPLSRACWRHEGPGITVKSRVHCTSPDGTGRSAGLAALPGEMAQSESLCPEGSGWALGSALHSALYFGGAPAVMGSSYPATRLNNMEVTGTSLDITLWKYSRRPAGAGTCWNAEC